MTLIDTSAWIEFFRKSGSRETKTRVATMIELGEAAYCGPVEFELLTGARASERKAVESALAFSNSLDFPRACWRLAADIEYSVRRKGVTVPRDDIFVAAAAKHHDVPLYTTDPHFSLIIQKGNVSILLV